MRSLLHFWRCSPAGVAVFPAGVEHPQPPRQIEPWAHMNRHLKAKFECSTVQHGASSTCCGRVHHILNPLQQWRHIMKTLQKACGPLRCISYLVEGLWTIALPCDALWCIAETLRKACRPFWCFTITVHAVQVAHPAVECITY